MLDCQQHYEAGMEEGEYLASTTDERCPDCNKQLLGWEVENEMCGECTDCTGRFIPTDPETGELPLPF